MPLTIQTASLDIPTLPCCSNACFLQLRLKSSILEHKRALHHTQHSFLVHLTVPLTLGLFLIMVLVARLIDLVFCLISKHSRNLLVRSII